MPPRSSIFRSITCVALVAASLTGAAAAAVVTASAAGAAGITHDDSVFAFGSASFHGSTDSLALPRPAAAIASTANGVGYWIVAQDGAVFSFNAPFYGALYPFPLAYPVVGMTVTPTGHGYWIVTSDGSVFPFGDAHFYGALTHTRLNSPIKALIAGPGGKGYWLYAADGGVFSFGSARFHGSTGGIRLNAPVVGMTATPSGNGYWLVARDGGIFTFGDARFHGSTGSFRLAAPIVGMARDGSGRGYWLAGSDGGVFTFGDARFRGSAAGHLAPGRHVVQLAGMPDGNGYRMLALRNIADVALVGPGATGSAVTYIQRRLAAMGYWLPSVNGRYDADMAQAVLAFQKVNGLPRTSVVDARTQAAFRTAGRPHARSAAGTLFEVDKTRQVLFYVQNDVVVAIWNASTGTDHPYTLDGVRYSAHTPEGLFHVVSQIDGPDVAPLGLLFRPKFFTNTGIAVHGDPPSNVPAYPASHGCTRISNAAINYIWASGIMPIGATVWVYV